MRNKKSDIKIQRDANVPTPEPQETWAPLATLREEIDRLFDDFGPSHWRRPLSRRMIGRFPSNIEWRLSPAVEVVECDGEYSLTAELPGLAPEDIEIRLTDGMISVRGEKSEERKEEKEDYILSERRYGSFHRTVPLPSGVDSSAIAAQFSNGVLTVTMPKSKEAKSKERKVEVKAA